MGKGWMWGEECRRRDACAREVMYGCMSGMYTSMKKREREREDGSERERGIGEGG